MGEVRKTIATSLAAAFGFIIALIWANVVFGGLAVAGVSMTPAGGIGGLAYFIVTAVVLTVIMIVLIIVISRWGNK
ncbi:MAG TPA: DUF5654 family protein [Thermoplasmata archaeon]